MTTFISIIHVFVCFVLMFVVLLQQGKGGGMGSAFGGSSAQVFGGSGAGNILTRATGICAGVFMLTSISLAYLASAKDSGLRAKIAAEEAQKKQGTRTAEEAPPAPATSASTEKNEAPKTETPAPATSGSATDTSTSTTPKAPASAPAKGAEAPAH